MVLNKPDQPKEQRDGKLMPDPKPKLTLLDVKDMTDAELDSALDEVLDDLLGKDKDQPVIKQRVAVES